ncbi:MAG: response regulator [Armatimonadia bacterium]|nr:response regulator [Armatimonadia bacterium]
MPLTVLLAAGDHERWEALEEAMSSLSLRVQRVETGEEALRENAATPPGLVMVGTDLPDVHALDICRRIRRDSDVPLIVLASDACEFDRVLALEVGADDVICCDRGADELKERMKAALRRGTGMEIERTEGEVLDFGNILVDRGQNRLVIDGPGCDLTPMETELMWELAEHAGEVLESGELLQRVWGYPPGLQTRTLDVHIGRLRKKLGEDGRHPRHILTVRSVGYRFEPDGGGGEDDEVAA